MHPLNHQHRLPTTVGAEHLPPVYTHNDEVRYGFRCGIQGGRYSAPTKVNNLVYTQDGIHSCEQPCLHPEMGFVRLYGLVITVGRDSLRVCDKKRASQRFATRLGD